MLKATNIDELKDYLDYHLYLQTYRFPFVVETLNFTYANEPEIKEADATVSKARVFNIPLGYLDVLKYKIMEEIISQMTNFNLPIPNFNYKYNRTETSNQLEEETIRLKDQLCDFLYLFPFITKANLGYNNGLPVLNNINGVSGFHTYYKLFKKCDFFVSSNTDSIQDHHRYLIDANIKESELEDFIKQSSEEKTLKIKSNGLSSISGVMLNTFIYDRRIYKEGLK